MTCYVCGISVLAAIFETLNSTDSRSSSYYDFLAATASLLPAYDASSYSAVVIVGDDGGCSRERGADGRNNATGSVLEDSVAADCSLLHCFCYCYCYSFKLFAKVALFNQLA